MPKPLSYQLPPDDLAKIWAQIREAPECLDEDRENGEGMQTVRKSIEQIHGDMQKRFSSYLERRAVANQQTIAKAAQRRNEIFQELPALHDSTERAELAFLLYSSDSVRSPLDSDVFAKRFESRFEELARALFVLGDLEHVELEARSHLAFLRRVRLCSF